MVRPVKETTADAFGAMGPFRPDLERSVRAKGQTGRFTKALSYPGFRSYLAPPAATGLPPLRGSS